VEDAMRNTLIRVLAFAIGLVAVGGASGCTFLVDRNGQQCSVDADCDKFGGHPSCVSGVCMPSGLGPEGCFVGTPMMQTDYLNACSKAETVPFDNCGRLGMCDSSMQWPTTIDPTPMSIPPLVNPVAAPTQNCSDVSPNRIYMYGTSDFAPMLQAAQPLLSAAHRARQTSRGCPVPCLVGNAAMTCNRQVFRCRPGDVRDEPAGSTGSDPDLLQEPPDRGELGEGSRPIWADQLPAGRGPAPVSAAG